MSELRPSKEELAAKATEEEDMQAVKLPRRSAQPLAVTSHARAKCQGLRSQYHNRVVWTFELTHYATIQQDSAFSRKEKKEEPPDISQENPQAKHTREATTNVT